MISLNQFDSDRSNVIHSVPQLSEEGDVPIRMFHQAHPPKQSKHGRGCPCKSDKPKAGSVQLDSDPLNVDPQCTSTKRGRGRPYKSVAPGPSTETSPRRGREDALVSISLLMILNMAH